MSVFLRLNLAKENGYADIIINSSKENVKDEILKYTDMRGVDKVFEVAGGKNTFSMAMDTARPNAVIVLVAIEVVIIHLQLILMKIQKLFQDKVMHYMLIQ